MAASGEGWGGEHGAGVAVGDDGGGAFFVAGECLVEGELELGGALFGVGDGGLVAVVAVGDDELLVCHGGEEEVDDLGIGDLPEAVDDVVFVGDGEVGCGGVGADHAADGFAGAAGAEDEFFGGEGGVGVEHVDLLAVGAGGLEEGEAVGFVFGEGLFVAVDDLVGVVVEVAEGDEAAALANLGGAGDGVGLGVAVDGWLGLFGEDVVAAPLVECVGGTGVDVVGLFASGEEVLWFGVAGLVLAEDDADEIVGAGFVVALLHGRGDLVVGLGDDVFHVDAGWVVTEGAEGVKTGHAFGFLQSWNMK